MIKSYNITFIEIGVFGSYARNDFKASSDIDFCIITESRPDRRTSGSLREDAELLGADIVYVTPYTSQLMIHNLLKILEEITGGYYEE